VKQVIVKKTRHSPISNSLWISKADITSRIENYKRGELVEIYDSTHNFIGIGYINPSSNISIRLLSTTKKEISVDFLSDRIKRAYRLRKTLYQNSEVFRVVFSESDLLPGLIVDKFDNLVVFQITTAGMEKLRSKIIQAIENTLHPEIIIEKSDSITRMKEGLESRVQPIKGHPTGEKIITINDIKFSINPLTSQKTGFFLDQRDNYNLLEKISAGKTVLDCFCFNGAFGLHALKHGAKHVKFVDSSQSAINATKKNLELNKIEENRYQLVKQDAFNFLNSSLSQKFDIIILDPPAFIKDRRKIENGIKGYKEINSKALKLLAPGGFLLTCSCSQLLSTKNFLQIIQYSSEKANREVKILKISHQSADHPFRPDIPDSIYLKCALLYAR